MKRIFQNSPLLIETSPNSLTFGLRSELYTEQKKDGASNYDVTGWRSIWVILSWEIFPKMETPGTYLQAFVHGSPHSPAQYSSFGSLPPNSLHPASSNVPWRCLHMSAPTDFQPLEGRDPVLVSCPSCPGMYELTHRGCSVLVELD